MRPLDIVLILVGLGFAVLWLRARSRVGRENARRGRVARRAEREAERLLESAGFEILERQVTHDWPMDVGGERVTARLRADLRVRRDGVEYVAEVKTGAAARATAPATRRQLLEYLLAFDVDGVLLVDMEEEEVLSVDFPRVDL